MITDAAHLPFPDGWASEILAIHSLEYVHPCELLPTLREWRRVLAAGDRAQVHVPNTTQLMPAFVEGRVEDKWRIMGALLGTYCGPQVRGPHELDAPADHQVLFDADVLRWALVEAGFQDVADVSESVTDRHTEGWAEIVPRFSLVMEACR